MTMFVARFMIIPVARGGSVGSVDSIVLLCGRRRRMRRRLSLGRGRYVEMRLHYHGRLRTWRSADSNVFPLIDKRNDQHRTKEQDQRDKRRNLNKRRASMLWNAAYNHLRGR